MMANIPNIYLLQVTKKNLTMAESFQRDMGARFFEHAMYDVKDAMSSILGLCDMADMKELEEVRKYIKRVNDTIADVSLYYDERNFNVKHVLLNVIRILEGNYRSRLNVTHKIAGMQAKVQGDQALLEKLLLYIVVEAIESSPELKQVSLDLELSQRERNALIEIKVQGIKLSEVARKEMLSLSGQSNFHTQIFVGPTGTEVDMRLPLTFQDERSQPKKKDISLSLSIDDLELRRKDTSKHYEKLKFTQ